MYLIHECIHYCFRSNGIGVDGSRFRSSEQPENVLSNTGFCRGLVRRVVQYGGTELVRIRINNSVLMRVVADRGGSVVP